jgi:flagellar biosynthetic protein FliR
MIEISLITIITALLTIAVRLTGLMLFAPFFGSSTISPQVKAGLVLALTLLLYPTVGRGIGTFSLAGWPIMAFTEFLIGAGMGIATNLVFDAAQLAGAILGIQMGYSLVNILDPQSLVNTTVVSVFYDSIVMLLFLSMNVHYWILRAIGESLLYLPPGTMHLSGLFTLGVIKTVGEVFSLGIQVAAPVLAATLVADVVLGLLGKASPQLPLMVLGPAIKSMLGLLVLISTLKYWPNLFHRLFSDTLAESVHLLHVAR